MFVLFKSILCNDLSLSLSLPFPSARCWIKTTKKRLAPRKKKEKNKPTLQFIFRFLTTRAHTRTIAPRKHDAARENKEREILFLCRVSGAKKRREQRQRKPRQQFGGFLEKNARVFVTARSTSAPLHAAFSGKKKKREKGARRYFKSIERKHESFLFFFFLFIIIL